MIPPKSTPIKYHTKMVVYKHNNNNHYDFHPHYNHHYNSLKWNFSHKSNLEVKCWPCRCSCVCKSSWRRKLSLSLNLSWLQFPGSHAKRKTQLLVCSLSLLSLALFLSRLVHTNSMAENCAGNCILSKCLDTTNKKLFVDLTKVFNDVAPRFPPDFATFATFITGILTFNLWLDDGGYRRIRLRRIECIGHVVLVVVVLLVVIGWKTTKL